MLKCIHMRNGRKIAFFSSWSTDFKEIQLWLSGKYRLTEEIQQSSVSQHGHEYKIEAKIIIKNHNMTLMVRHLQHLLRHLEVGWGGANFTLTFTTNSSAPKNTQKANIYSIWNTQRSFLSSERILKYWSQEQNIHPKVEKNQSWQSLKIRLDGQQNGSRNDLSRK